MALSVLVRYSILRMAPPHAHSVLVVDDDEDNLEAMLLYLEASGLMVRGATAADDALQQLRAGLRPCVVVVDVIMPDVDGWTLVERLRANPALADMCVLMHSGAQEDPARARELDVRGFLLKPSEPSAIVEAIARHCPASGLTGSAERASTWA